MSASVVPLFEVHPLARKFVTTFHLSVEEARSFGPAGIPGSLVRSAVAALVEKVGHFPLGWKKDDGFDGGFIERAADGTYTVIWKAECGVAKFTVVGEPQAFSSVVEAADAYARRFFGSEFDGIRLNWDA